MRPLQHFGSLLVFLHLAVTLGCTPREVPDSPQKVMPGSLEAQCNRLYMLNDRGHRISWKGRVPVVFKLDPAFPKEMIPPLESAMTTYNATAGYALFKLDGYRADISYGDPDSQNTIYWLGDDDRSRAIHQRFARVFVREHGIAATRMLSEGNRLYEVKIVFNAIDFTINQSRVHVWSHDLEAVALHELGHSLGLDHDLIDGNSTMTPGLLPFGWATRRLDRTTKTMLACEY